MLEKLDYRTTSDKMQKIIFNELISPTEYHTFVCEQNTVGYRYGDPRYYRVKRMVTKKNADRELDNTQIDVPVTNQSGVDNINEDYEFIVAPNATTSGDITHRDGATITRQPILVA